MGQANCSQLGKNAPLAERIPHSAIKRFPHIEYAVFSSFLALVPYLKASSMRNSELDEEPRP